MSVIYKQQRSLNRVNKILDTAHNVLIDGEINDLSIANLTKVADLKRTSTYKFFPHPDDIKIALIERYINELKEKLENFNVSSSEHHQTLKELINEIYLYFKENISAQKIILANTVNPPVDSAKLQALSNLLVNKIEAASYEHVQSKRNLFPSFSLTARGGTSASDLNDILNGDYSVWNFGANITAPLFQSGRLRNNVKLKDSQLTISEIDAAKIMVRAFSEVEQALYIQNAIRDQLRAVSTAEQQAQAAYLLAFDRYQKGLVDLITVLNSQNQWRNTQSLQISFQKNQISSYINLLLALGGNF